jgi:hypothetical protein
MPKFTVYRTSSPSYHKRNQKSIMRPVEAIKTPGFSLGLPQTIIIYPQNDVGRYRIRTVLGPRMERKVIRAAAKTPDLESLWPRHSIPSKDNSSHSRLLKHGIKIKKITQFPTPNPKCFSLSHVSKANTEDFRPKCNKLNRSSEKDYREISEIVLECEGKRQMSSMDDSCIGSSTAHNTSSVTAPELCNNTANHSELPSIWAPIQRNGSPEIRHAFTSYAVKKKVIKKVEKVSVKEAMRDKEWLTKAKTQLLRDFNLHINWSNGLTVQPPNESGLTYKYFLGKGNNSKLVKQLMSSRWWWVRVSEEEMHLAHLVWTQWKEWGYIRSLPCLNDVKTEVQANCSVSIDSKTKYLPVSVNNVISQPKVVDVTPLGFDLITKAQSYVHMLANCTYETVDLMLHNKIEHNYHLANKKALFYNLVKYYEALGKNPFEYIPLTFHIKTGENDPVFHQFLEIFAEFEGKIDENGKKIANLWIVKPGENTNRGNGITVAADLASIKSELKSNPCPSTGQHTFILQKYIEKPFLVNKRKFDIRCYALITSINSVLQGYFYQEGYIRTSSKPFSLSNTNKFVHLTNDAVQQKCEEYGKFEKANKMSYLDFQRYLDNHHPAKTNFQTEILPQIKEMVKDTIQAVFLKIDTNKRGHTFEVFGYDFLLDCNLKPWLLEVNTNPCLELSSPHLARIIPAMLENAFKIAIDPLFPEPQHVKRVSTEVLAENKYELIFHSSVDGKGVEEQLRGLEKFKEFCEVDESLLEMVNEESEEHPDSDENNE